MALMDRVLQVPEYGWEDENGEFVKPTKAQIMKEFWSRMNFFKDKKNWIHPMAWLYVAVLFPSMFILIGWYLTWPIFIVTAIYSAVIMSTHGTIWYHRYCTHRAYTFRNKFWRFFTQNIVVKTIPEETYVVSHHVHHAKSDKPGDPYNAQGGFLYCFLADVNHQPIAKDLTEREYELTTKFLSHTGIYINSYKQYQKWGSVTNPFYAISGAILNWAFWFTVCYFIAGPGLGLGLFTGAMLWAIGVRTFNYQGHGQGEDQRREGIDYNWKDMSVNQSRPGYLGGEWHNNHHLYPNGARAGFLPYQWDNAWAYIWFMHKIGAVKSYKDYKENFLKEYVIPNKKAENTRSKKKRSKVLEPDIKLGANTQEEPVAVPVEARGTSE